MQDFVFGRMRAQEAAPEPYTLYNKEKTLEEPKTENITLRDIEYFKSMYPARMKELQIHVESVFDEMEYEGSPLYDEYPDRLMVEQLRRKVEALMGESENEAAPAEIPAETAASAEPEQMEAYEVHPVSAFCGQPRMPYGPQMPRVPSRGCQVWEMEEAPILEAEEEMTMETSERRPGPPGTPWGPPPPRPGNPWGPPPPPRPGNPWGPPPPRPGNPWGPPPPRPGNPWGPPPPPRPGTPWGPPPPPRPGTPWGPPPPRPGGRVDLGDAITLLLLGELQHRRCRRRQCG